MTSQQIEEFIAQATPHQRIRISIPQYVHVYEGNLVGNNERFVHLRDDRDVTVLLEKTKIGTIEKI